MNIIKYEYNKNINVFEETSLTHKKLQEIIPGLASKVVFRYIYNMYIFIIYNKYIYMDKMCNKEICHGCSKFHKY